MMNNENLDRSQPAAFVHVAFGHSAAHALRRALARMSRSEHVAMFPDHLGFGPIRSLSARISFYTDIMLFEPNPQIKRELDAFSHDIAANLETQIAWFSRRCVEEYSGFLAYLSQRDSPPMFIDIADSGLACASHLNEDRFLKLDHISRVSRLASEAFIEARTRWHLLMKENAPLRVLTPSGLVSAPIDYFDDDIRACVTDDWQKGARVLGDASYRVNSGEFSQTSDSFLWFRLRYLMEEGVLDFEGDVSDMRKCRVRTKRRLTS